MVERQPHIHQIKRGSCKVTIEMLDLARLRWYGSFEMSRGEEFAIPLSQGIHCNEVDALLEMPFPQRRRRSCRTVENLIRFASCTRGEIAGDVVLKLAGWIKANV